jgi:hypothetical protein
MIHKLWVLSAAAVMLGATSLRSPAGAETTLKIKCTSVTATVGLGGNLTLSGCSGNTGGSGSFVPLSSIGINWANGKTTGAQVTGTISADSDFDPHGICPAGTEEEEVKGTVTSDTTGSAPVGGLAFFELCVSTTTNNTSNEPGSAAKFK